MRWSHVLFTVVGAALGSGLAGCQFLVTFESVPEDGGGSGGTVSTGGTISTGGTTSAGGTTTGGTGGTGGTTCSTECCSPLDCPVPTDPCQQAACAMGLCGTEPVPEDGPATTQIPGDCKLSVCKGGLVVRINDPTDPLDDGNACTVDECDGSGPEVQPVQSGTVCILDAGGPGVCDGKGKCVGCLSNAHCPPDLPKCETDARKCVPQSCNDGTKNGSETGNDCGGPACAPCNFATCMVGTDCLSGVCMLGFCGPSTCFDGTRNGNESDVDCGDGCPTKCETGQKCNKDGDCKSDACTGQGGVCLPSCKDGLKNGIETDVDCGGGECSPCYGGQACGGADAYCHSGDCGPAGTCEPGPDGTNCKTDAHCVSTFCVDGVCCSGACTGTCKRCDLAGKMGTCSNLPAGTDPDGECADAETCNGSGNCAP